MKSVFAVCLTGVLALVQNVCGYGIALDRVEPSNPWNGTVRIDYTISATEGVGTLSFSLEDAVGGTPVAVKTFFQEPSVAVGRHSVIWDADADGVTFRIQSAKIVAKLNIPPAYMIIDVSGGSTSETFRVSYLGDPPTGGFEANAFMGDKIALRLIPAGTYESGPREGDLVKTGAVAESGTRTLSEFYIGIFEMTQKQYVNVSGSTVACANPGDYYPRDRVSYEDVCGAGRKPSGSVLANSFAGVLNAKCRAADENGNWTVRVEGFDLPSQWEWEYACRAGTTTPYNSGNVLAANADAYVADLWTLGRFLDNVSEGKGGSTSKSTTVGSYEPNAWGLYDMHGNVWEWVRDLKPTTSSPFVCGGCSGNTYDICTSYARASEGPTYRSDYGGFRLYVPVPREASFEVKSTPVDVTFDFSACHREQAGQKIVSLDSRSGVLVVSQRGDIFPFAYSQTNFTGVAGANAQSVATISVVQVRGEGDDVSKWTTEVAGTARTLVPEKQGEGAVKWRGVKPGVWKAEFVIKTNGGEVHRETRVLDLRKYVGQGLVFFLT